MINRMTAILDTFDSPRRCRSLEQIAELTGIPRSTAHRILGQLAQTGWVERNVTAGYRLGWRANQLPSRANEESQLREAAAPHLFTLASHTRLAIHLAVLDGADVRYLDKLGRQAGDCPTRVGGTLPAHLTAVGKAMLAFTDPELLDGVLGGLRVRVDTGAVHRDLASVRNRAGLATLRHGAPVSWVGIGVPIFVRDHQVAGALSLCDAGTGQPVDCHVPLLFEAAKRISVQFGQRQAARPARQAGLSRRGRATRPRAVRHGAVPLLLRYPAASVPLGARMSWVTA